MADPGGYVPPPLDGIWASAPYFHNGSVPTVWHVLHPDERPKVWLRSEDGYDFKSVGLEFEIFETLPPQPAPRAKSAAATSTRRKRARAPPAIASRTCSTRRKSERCWSISRRSECGRLDKSRPGSTNSSSTNFAPYLRCKSLRKPSQAYSLVNRGAVIFEKLDELFDAACHQLGNPRKEVSTLPSGSRTATQGMPPDCGRKHFMNFRTICVTRRIDLEKDVVRVKHCLMLFPIERQQLARLAVNSCFLQEDVFVFASSLGKSVG